MLLIMGRGFKDNLKYKQIQKHRGFSRNCQYCKLMDKVIRLESARK